MATKTWTQAQVDFATEVANKTGADFYTIFGWEIAEGGPPDNPLNIGPGKHFGSPVKAADATAQLIETSNFYTDILRSFQGKYANQDKEIAAQAKAIAYNTHWNVIDPRTHTPAQIQALRARYLSNISSGALQALYEGVQPNSKIDTGGNIQNPPDNPGGIIGGISSATDALGSIAHDIAAPFEWVSANWDRLLFVIGGTILVILALVLVIRQQSQPKFTFDRGDS